MDAIEQCRIAEGSLWTYTPAWPEGCQGKLYRVLRFVPDVPSYQRKVLIEAIDGPDAGLWFTASLANFALRYQPAPPDPPPPEKPAPAPSDPGKGY